MKIIPYKEAEIKTYSGNAPKGVVGRVVIGKNDGAKNLCMRVFELDPETYTGKTLGAGGAVERDGYRIEAFAVAHGVGALGYALREDERPGRFDVDAADALGVPDGPARGALQRGEPVTLDDGRVVAPEEVVGPARRGRSVVLTGDTSPAASVVEAATGADVLVHEATFLADERARARETGHSTAGEAALVAREAGVGLLALTHLSARYAATEVAEEARCPVPAVGRPARLRPRHGAVSRARLSGARGAWRPTRPAGRCRVRGMTELVQVAVVGSVDEAEELQALLTRAGIEATLEGAVEEHPGARGRPAAAPRVRGGARRGTRRDRGSHRAGRPAARVGRSAAPTAG